MFGEECSRFSLTSKVNQPIMVNDVGILAHPSGHLISLWEQKENAETYSRGAYPEVLKAMAKVIEGTPQVQTSEVSNSTWHKIAAL